MDLDEAISILIELLQAGRAGSYGYDLYPRRGAEEAAARMRLQPLQDQEVIRDLSPVFYEAAWELCRRGIVRPGVRRSGDQGVPEGGYSVTLAGRASLAALDPTTILLAQPGSLAAALTSYRQRFGDGFHQRALEAIKCRNMEAWLACCAMTGAAAESVLLALAIAKVGDEDQVLGAYKGKISLRAKLTGHRGIYHMEGCRSYRSTKTPNRWFCSEEDAQAAGFRKAFNC
jgi:hypothetical protein